MNYANMQFAALIAAIITISSLAAVPKSSLMHMVAEGLKAHTNALKTVQPNTETPSVALTASFQEASFELNEGILRFLGLDATGLRRKAFGIASGFVLRGIGYLLYSKSEKCLQPSYQDPFITYMKNFPLPGDALTGQFLPDQMWNDLSGRHFAPVLKTCADVLHRASGGG